MKNIVVGRVHAEAFSAYPEGLINAAVASGIEVLNIVRLDENRISFELLESCTEELRFLAEKNGVELKLFPKAENRRRVFRKRFLLLPITALLGFMLLVSSLFIWQIDVHGNHRISRGELLRALEDSGVALGSFWPGLRADDIRSQVMLLLPDIGWMTVNISGSRAVVLINERESKPEIYNESGETELVAARSGIVRRVSVLSGKPMVEPGQAVTEGEVLVSGRLDSIMGTERLVRSRASVMAETWYEIDAVCPEKEDMKTEKDLTRHRFALVLGKRRINFYFSSGKAIDECDKIIDEYTLGVEGHFALPIKLVHERIIPYDSTPGPGYDPAAMGRRLNALLDEQVEGQILQSSLSGSNADGLSVLSLRAHCMENIAITRDGGA